LKTQTGVARAGNRRLSSATFCGEDREIEGYGSEIIVPVGDYYLPQGSPAGVRPLLHYYASVANENVKFTVPITSQLDELRQVFAPFNVSACLGRFTASILNAGHQRLRPIQSPGPKYNLHTTLREQECCGLTNSAACPGDRKNFVFDS
jgi:hypothetical protein